LKVEVQGLSFELQMKFAALGDSAVIVSLGSGVDESALPRVRALAAAIERARAPAILDVVPAFATVAVYYDPVRFAGFAGKPYDNICRYISDCAERGSAERGQVDKIDPAPSRINFINLSPSIVSPSIEIPVCYGGDFGPDLAAVAAHCRLAPDEVVARHSGADYRVHAIGFVPGFPYLAGLPRELQMPRRDTPRLSVAAGSVGIGGAQTGVYPIATPGGWQLIGRSPLELFSPAHTLPALLKTGDRVKFRSISPEEFEEFIRLRGQVDEIERQRVQVEHYAVAEGVRTEGVAPIFF
jgi:inhibitor of KinA